MTRSLLNIVTLLLIISFSAVCFAEDDAERGDVSLSSGAKQLATLKGPAFESILRMSDKNFDRVKEVQATLNLTLRGKSIRVDGAIELDNAEGIADEGRNQIKKLHFTDGTYLVLPGDTVEVTNGNEDVSGEPFTKILLSSHPVNVDGIYGPRTFAMVYLFQITRDLTPTGEVDALTLDRLEPMIPPNWVLASLMEMLMEKKALPLSPVLAKGCTAALMTLLILLVSAAIFQVARVLAKSPELLATIIFAEKDSHWLKTLINQRFFLRMAQWAPALFIYCAADFFPSPESSIADPFPYLRTFETWHVIVARFGLSYAAVVSLLVALCFMDAVHETYTSELPPDNPIEGIIRAAKRIITVIGLVLILSAVTGETPMYFIGGIGALMAIVVLVFRDVILGLVASVQIVVNRMVDIGDWIEMPQYGADGDVKSISLSCVKVQNFDKTMSTIPTHKILSESFRNWSSMREAGGRRIKRCLYIDINTIRVCDSRMLNQLEKIELLHDHVSIKRELLKIHNEEHDGKASPVNVRRLTNIGLFRTYAELYLKSLAASTVDNEEEPRIKVDGMTMLVRHRESTEIGLPVEIVAFCSRTTWGEFEDVQADIFDHLLSILTHFGLRAYQSPTDATEKATLAAK